MELHGTPVFIHELNLHVELVLVYVYLTLLLFISKLQ